MLYYATRLFGLLSIARYPTSHMYYTRKMDPVIAQTHCQYLSYSTYKVYDSKFR